MKRDPLSDDESAKSQDELLRMIARRRETSYQTAIEPQRVGASFFFEVKGGWEVRALVDDLNVRKVYTASGLEDAFHDKTVRTILIPRDSNVNRNIALRVCSRHGEGKTVFFEMLPPE